MRNNDYALDKACVARIVDSIISVLPVESILLFGSYAKGEQKDDSDIDLYIVTKNEAADALNSTRVARRSLQWLKQPKDIVCSCQSDFSQKSLDFAALEHTVFREGIKLYG